MIKESYNSLKRVVILFCPLNSNSFLYKLKHDLAFLDKKTNFYVPGEADLTNALINFGLKLKKLNFLY